MKIIDDQVSYRNIYNRDTPYVCTMLIARSSQSRRHSTSQIRSLLDANQIPHASNDLINAHMRLGRNQS